MRAAGVPVAMKHRNLLSFAILLVATHMAGAVNQTKPFEVIARENAFRLKPPTPKEKQPIPMLDRPQITLQGFTTILGRAQVLLNIQLVGTTGISCVLSENQNQHGVTILKIDAKTETVRLNNLGLEQTLIFDRHGRSQNVQ